MVTWRYSVRSLLGFALVVLLVSLAQAQEQAPKVAVLPFVVHAQEDAQQIRNNLIEIFNKQLSTEGGQVVETPEILKAFKAGEAVQTEEQAKAAARRFGADYALMGSFNQIGTSISIDARLVNVSGSKPTATLFAENRGMENLAAATNQVVQQMAVHLMAKALVAEIKFRGNERIEANAIKAVLKTKKGDLLRAEQVRDDIKAIFKMGYFTKVDADVTDSPTGKILTFIVEENPTIQELNVKGAKKIKEKDILAAIATRQYTLLQQNIVTDDVQKIIKLYQQKGYYNAEVTSSVDFPKDPHKAVVTFNIKENDKVFIRSIEFDGNKSFSARKLRGVIQTKKKNLLSWLLDTGTLQKENLDSDADRLTIFYHDNGFMDAKVGSPEVTLLKDGFHLRFPIDEGQRYKVTSIKMTGDTLDEDGKPLQKKLQLKEKETFSREKLRHDIDAISKAYMDEGYAHTEVSPNIQRETAAHTTDITYNVRKKDVVHIGRITVVGNTKTRDLVIRRELELSEGDQFSATKLDRSIQNLRKLDFFEEVEITPKDGEQPGTMDLLVKVKEKMTGTISVGGGYSSDDGFFTSGQIVQTNFQGKGQYIGVKAYLGQEAQRYIASYTEPWFMGYHFAAGIDLYDWIRDYTDFTKKSVGSRLRTSYPFGKYSKWLTYYTLEQNRVSDVDDDAAEYIVSQEGKLIKSSITTGFERDTTNDPFLPTRGTLSSVVAEWSSPYFGSDSDFVKVEAQHGFFFPLFWKFTGFLKGQYGYIFETGDEEVPVYENFFLGGINNLRGFEWGKVGPFVKNKDGDPDYIGGRTYVVGTAELLFPLYEKIGLRGVLFFDAGNVYTDSISFSDIRTDAGLGVRWHSPFGPLRIEWGYNLDPKNDEDQYQFQFSAGAFF